MRRRTPGNVPSSIRLDHGDVLVMDGLAQSEYEHCMASGLQGPRVNLTYHCVLSTSRRSGRVLPTCVQGAAEPGSRWLGVGKINGPLLGDWSSFCWSWCLSSWSVPGFTSGGDIVTVVSVYPARRCTSPPGVVPFVLGTALATVTTSPIFQGFVFLYPFCIFYGDKLYSFSESMVSGFSLPAGYAKLSGSPPCYHDAYSVGTPNRAFREERLAETL